MKAAESETDPTAEAEHETPSLATEPSGEPDAEQMPAEEAVEEPAFATQPAAQAKPRAAGRRRGGLNPDGTGPAAFGLIVIWACMTLVFYAHRESNAYIHLEAPFAGTLPTQDTQVRPDSLTPQVALQWPISLFQRDTTTKQMLTTLAGYLGFTISAAELEKLGDAGDAPKSVRLEKTPVYSALHQVMSDPRYGIGLRGEALLIFAQTLDTARGGNHVQEMKWQADLELRAEPLMIFPSADSDLWFKVRVAGGADAEQAQQSALEIEVWRGAEWLSMARVELDASGTAQLTMSNVENSQFIVHRTAPTAGAAPLYNLQFLKQSFSQAKTES